MKDMIAYFSRLLIAEQHGQGSFQNYVMTDGNHCFWFLAAVFFYICIPKDDTAVFAVCLLEDNSQMIKLKLKSKHAECYHICRPHFMQSPTVPAVAPAEAGTRFIDTVWIKC